MWQTPPAGAVEVGNGPAEINLAVCAAGDTQTDSFIPDCSYTYLTKVAAPSYTYITSQGAVAWKGTAAGSALSFPASGQTWPTLTNLFLGASRTTTPKDITGTIDANGKVDLVLSYERLLKTGSNECTLTGTVQLSSQGTEKLGGQAVGKNYDPATGQFAVVSTAYTDPYVGAGDCGASGADAFLPLPAAPALVESRLSAALARREPLERLGVLPTDRARYIDALFERLDRLSYYELLELDADADDAAIRQAFHQRSLILHPDRYTRLRTTWPHAYDRINAIYKRFNEASRVLMDAGQRSRYNLGLQQRGAVRLEQSRRSKREEKELAMCRTPAARDLVLQSLELRSLGDLEGAEEPMAEACALEPENVDLAQVLAAIRKLLDIMRRG